MHNAVFHKYNKQRKYLPLWLRAEDVHSICSLSFQLRIDYAVKQLTSIPVTESDIRFTWVQISGVEPLEFSDYHAAEPFIVLNPDVVEDMLFKVYIDKDESTELVADVWIYRTPTEKTLQYVEKIVTSTPQGLTVNNNPAESIPSVIKNLFPDDVSISENLRNGEALVQEDIVSFTVIAERKEPASTNIGAEILSFEVYDTVTDGLIGLNTTGELAAVIPKEVSTVYLKIKLSVYNNISGAVPKIYTITSKKVYSTPVRYFNDTENALRLYAQESTKQLLNSDVTYYTSVNKTYTIPPRLRIENIEPLPELVGYTEWQPRISAVNLTKVTFLPKLLEVTDEVKAFNAQLAINIKAGSKNTITRYNVIIIGG